MTLRPQLKATTPGLLTFRTSPVQRTLYTAIALLMLTMMVASGAAGLVPTILVLVTGIGALLVDNWEFDAERREVRQRTGVLPFVRTRTYAVADIERVEVYAAVNRRGGTEFRRLVLALGDGRRPVVDMGRGHEELEVSAKQIADHLGVAFALHSPNIDKAFGADQ